MRYNISPGEPFDRETFTDEHQQIKRQSCEVFTETIILPGRDHEYIDIGVRSVITPCNRTEEDDLLYLIAARLPRLCRKLMDHRPANRKHIWNW